MWQIRSTTLGHHKKIKSAVAMAFLVTTGILFALIAILQIWRMIVEWPSLARYLVRDGHRRDRLPLAL
jgi:hypothetical protein